MLLNCIGDIHLHYDSENKRVRQIVTEYVDDPATLHRVLSEADRFASLRSATRIAVRALTRQSCLPSAMAIAASRRYRVESIIPIGSAFTEYAFVAYGRNLGCRYSKPAVVLRQQQMLSEVRSRPMLRSEAAILAEARAQGFAIERLQGVPSETDRHDLIAMVCSSLSENPASVGSELDQLLTDDKHTVVALRSSHTGRLHSMCVSERKDVLMRDGRTLRLAEKAWAVKQQGTEATSARGLSILLHLAVQADAFENGTHVLFAESRSSLIAINRINHCIGMTAGGMLEKHVEIGGEEDIVEGKSDSHSVYRNMNVWFIKYDELRAAGPRLARLFQSAVTNGALADATN